ncbi:MAG: ABC transporter permease [Bacteroidota bacterium]
MFATFITSCFRNIKRHKGFSFINIAGLTLGLTACLIIGLFVRDEKQYDKFIPGSERIYRVYQQSEADVTNIIASAPPTFATTLKQNYPEVEKTVRVVGINTSELFEAGNKKLYQQGGLIADSNFFDLFPLRFRYGSPIQALEDPNSIVISAGMARQFFGNQDPVGKEIIMDKSVITVKGVIAENQQFHLPVNYIISMSQAGYKGDFMQSWQWYPFHTYVLLQKGANVQQLEKKFQAYSKPFLKGEGPSNVPYFQPLLNIHLHSSHFKYDISDRGNISYVKALTLISIFILLIACFNFVNLATSQSVQRAKEVGVRKTIGAGRKQLLLQFIGETVFLALISMVMAVAATYMLLPSLNHFTEKHIQFSFLIDPAIAFLILAVVVVVGILAGFYPALVLSSFKPINVLKGNVVADTASGKTPWLRHGLVVIQFSLSVLLIISAIVVIGQVNYLHNKDLGFRKEQIMFFPIKGEALAENYESFKNELLTYQHVVSVSVGYGFPGDMFGDGMMTVKEKPELGPIRATQLMVDEDYIKTLGLTLMAGRDFSKDKKTDESTWIINETAVRELGLGSSPEQAIGKTLSWPTWRKSDSLKTGPVIGVVKDFHFKSLHQKVEPAVLQIYPQAYSKIAVKIKGANLEKTITGIKTLWTKFSPDYPIEFSFLDESFTKMYKAEDKLKTLILLFTVITIFVACLGLLGLAAYSAERRRKEIGIRKVLGASVNGVVILLSKDFVKLVLIGLVIASPIAWYFMTQWLTTFSYRIDIKWWVYAVAGMIAVGLALVTVSLQAVKAALANPVNNLRSE